METYIVGHKNPDTDSIVTAIALADLKSKLGKNIKPARPGELNKETLYLLKRFGFGVPEMISNSEKQVILVDHNEPSQVSENVLPEEIIAIYDHHKLGGLSTPGPIKVQIKPLACVATIIAKKYKKKGIEPTPEIAGILIGAVISDTLKFTSPTTTEKDKEIVEWLNQFAKVDINKLADEMFEAKSDISDISTESLICADYKIFEMGDKKVGIGVWETAKPGLILKRKTEILEKLIEEKEKNKLNYIFFYAVDILNSKSDLFIATDAESEVAKGVYQRDVVGSIMDLPGIISRKKQMAPLIQNYLTK